MPDEKVQSTENRRDTQWSRLIEDMHQWPWDAPEWESVQVRGFIDQVQLIAEQKCQEREEAGRLQIQQVLDQLREEHEATLVNYFLCSGLATWEAASCPIDRIDEQLKKTQDLLTQLNQRQIIYQQIPQNYLEGRKKWAELESVERRIRSLVEQLDQDLSAALPESPPLDGVAKEDDPPPPQPPSPVQGPLDDLPASEQGPKAEEDADSSEKVLQQEASLKEEGELAPPPAPQFPDEKPLSLRPAQEVAVVLQEDQSDEHWESLGWSLLAEDDLAGAYWLARSLEAAGRDVAIAPELLAVLQGSRWLENDTDSLVSDIRQIVSEWERQGTTSERRLSLAAALRPSLVAQHTGLVSWLPQREEVDSVLGALAEAIRTFASAGHPLRAEDMQSVEGRETHEEQIREIGEQARLFLENNRANKKLKVKRATDVLHRLVLQEGDLHLLLTPISENKADQVAQVQQRMKDFGERRQIKRCLHQIDQDLAGAKKRKITGDPINQLVRSVEEAVGLARRWCSLIAQEKTEHQKGDWRGERVEALRCLVQDVLPDINDELKRMQAPEQPQEEVALGRVLQRSIGQVAGMLGLEEQAGIEVPETWMKRGSSSLEGALSRRLLYLPEISLDEDGLPEKDQEAAIAGYLRQSLAEKRFLPMAWDMRIEGQDFRFTDVLRDVLENDADRQRLEERNDEELKSAQAVLKDTVNKVEGAIEKGLVDGLIAEEERAALNAELPRAEDALYFPPLLQQLSDIEKRLNQRLEERLQELEVQWKEMRQGLEQSIQADLTTAAASIESAFVHRDTRVIEESLAHLREIRDGEREWQDEWFIRPDKPDIFKKFQEACPRIEETLSSLRNVAQLAEVIEQGQTWADMEFGELPQECREEAAKALHSWHQLKRGQQNKNQRHIQVLLQYLGFRPLEGKPAVSVGVKKRDQDWLYCQVDASASGLARPIPQLGSQASGCYNVVCFWTRPRAASIEAFLRELGLDTKTVIIFFLGRLTDRQRCDIAAQARKRELALVVLDEILLVFLARLDDTRLPTFLRCSLPYAALNPYTPFQPGNVPPEMYYGRDKMIRQLREGSCIVFGGRQLGKSSLLRQVEREFHQPEREQYAWVEDIKLVGDVLTGEPPARLWIKLRDGFKNHSLIRATEANQPERIRQYIEKAMAESPQRRVLVLFDEADHFLSADAKNGFQVVEGLRNLMSNTQGYFMVVFAGLHDVQRFNNIANQPLAHFGRTVLVGPLEAGPAQQLVQEPLEILGYRFADETTALKVLSYTNYHPGLIQFFCHELVNRLQDKRYLSGPPYKVLADDVEAVYRIPRVRQVIRERLDWTLALDARYQCIAWAMIYAQKETRDSYVRSFSAAELLELVQDWWSQGFEKCDSQIFEVLLEEMVGLGILIRNLDQYLLRSPNLVRLMGTVEDIEYRLLELAEKFPPSQRRPESQHVLLDSQSRLYSPLTLSQESDLQKSGESGVTLVFGTPVLGQDVLDRALKRIGGRKIPNQELTKVEQTCRWLDDYARQPRGADQSLAYGQLKGTGGNMAQCVWRVWNMCETVKKGRRRPLKVVFILNPAATRSWLKVAADQRTDRENKAGLVYLHRWDEVGIQQRLSQAEKLDSPEVCQKVLEATGGWSVLLDALLQQCGDHTDPRPYADTLIEEMGSELLHQIGLDERESRVLRKLAALGTVQDTDEDLETLISFINEDIPTDDDSLALDDCRLTVEFLHRLQCLEKKNGEYCVESVLSRVINPL